MKAHTALILVSIIIVSFSVITSPVLAYGELTVGVKEGDWIEYNIEVTGTGSMPPTHDVRWMRMEILQVQGAAFSVNLTSRYANDTVGWAIWEFNFTEGNLGGWLIIPANLGLGDTFYDSSMHNDDPVNVTIQGQEQRTVLGATRTVTYGNDSIRHKDWDKATGVFVASFETYRNVTTKNGWYIEDLTVDIQAIATNMWSPQVSREVSQALLPTLGVVGLALTVMLSFVLVLSRNKWIKTLTFSSALQGKIAALTILAVVLVIVGGIFVFPFYEVGLTFAEINLVMQTIWTALVLVSMWLRMKGNYFAHELMMLAVVCAWVVGFSAVLFMDPFSSSSAETFAGTPLRLIMNGLHAIFSIPALAFSLWLVALWRPGSITFAAKSRRIALLTVAFWVPSYAVGVLDFMILHTTIFG